MYLFILLLISVKTQILMYCNNFTAKKDDKKVTQLFFFYLSHLHYRFHMIFFLYLHYTFYLSMHSTTFLELEVITIANLVQLINIYIYIYIYTL